MLSYSHRSSRQSSEATLQKRHTRRSRASFSPHLITLRYASKDALALCRHLFNPQAWRRDSGDGVQHVSDGLQLGTCDETTSRSLEATLYLLKIENLDAFQIGMSYLGSVACRILVLRLVVGPPSAL